MFKKLLTITCKKATFLASKKEEGKTTFLENLTLKLHYNICDGCRLFARQTGWMGKQAGHMHEHHDLTLSKEKKDKIKESIKASIYILFISMAGS